MDYDLSDIDLFDSTGLAVNDEKPPAAVPAERKKPAAGDLSGEPFSDAAPVIENLDGTGLAVNDEKPPAAAPAERKKPAAGDLSGEPLSGAVPVIENLDGTEINEEEEKEKQAMLFSAPDHTDLQHQEKLYSYDDSDSGPDPYGVYECSSKGRQTVKAIAVVVSVISAIGFLVSVFNGRGPAALAAAVRIFSAYHMVQGKNWGRIVIIISLAVSLYGDLALLFADTGSTDLIKAFYVAMLLIHGSLEYILCRDDKVRTYFGK